MAIVHSDIVSNRKMTLNQEKLLQQTLGEKWPPFEKVKNAAEHASKRLLIKHLKLIVTKKFKGQVNTRSTSLHWFYLLHMVWLQERHLAKVAQSPVHEKENYKGLTTENKEHPLDNLVMTSGEKVCNMHDLALVDNDGNVRSSSL